MADRAYDYDPDRAMWGDDMRYAAPPRFSVLPAVAPRLIHEANGHGQSVAVHAQRLAAHLDSVIAHSIPRADLQSVADEITDAQAALADAVAKLARLV